MNKLPEITLLFWVACVLTRPFGATAGDLLTKDVSKQGLGFGTIGSSLILFAVLPGQVIYTTWQLRQPEAEADIRLR